MSDNLLGLIAEARAGHDKGNLYIIIREEAEYAWVADGKNKTLAKPKRKNKKHLQVIKEKVDEELRAKLLNNKAITNEEIKRALKR
jgi:ribosomal protein L14E/L6E/L27E